MPIIGDIDFFQIDVQGAELDVLRGAEATLRNAVMVQTEVEFVPMYVGQPLFSDVDVVLRKAGFAFHRFTILGDLHSARSCAATDGRER